MFSFQIDDNLKHQIYIKLCIYITENLSLYTWRSNEVLLINCTSHIAIFCSSYVQIRPSTTLWKHGVANSWLRLHTRPYQIRASVFTSVICSSQWTQWADQPRKTRNSSIYSSVRDTNGGFQSQGIKSVWQLIVAQMAKWWPTWPSQLVDCLTLNRHKRGVKVHNSECFSTAQENEFSRMFNLTCLFFSKTGIK